MNAPNSQSSAEVLTSADVLAKLYDEHGPIHPPTYDQDAAMQSVSRQMVAEPPGFSRAANSDSELGSLDPDVPRIELIRGDQVAPEPVSWLWAGWLAAGKLHILAGPPGTGKTTLAL